jgi:hypothetical protein
MFALETQMSTGYVLKKHERFKTHILQVFALC